jgi:NADH dehydrogenase
LRGGEDNIESVDLKGNLSLIAAAKQAGVSHFIFTSVFPPATPESPNPFIAAKGTAEQALRQSGMDFTILAPNAFMDIWAMTVVGMPILKEQPVTLIEPGSHRNSLIAVEDIVGYAVAAVDNPAARNAYLSLGGPQALSWKDILATFERFTGCTAKVSMIKPGETVPGQPYWVTQMMPMFEAYEAIQDMSELSKVYGVPGTTLEEFTQRTLAGMKR